MNRLIVFVLATVLWQPSAAQESISYISQSNDHLVFGLDTTKSKKSSISSGWTEWKQFVPPGSEELGTVTKELYAADCGERRLALRAATEYEDASLSRVIKTFQAEPSKENYSDVVPGSMGESIFMWLCKPTPKKRKAPKAGA